MQAHHSSKELEDIIKECFELAKDVDPDEGKIADYIPQLGQVNPELYGVSFCDIQGRLYNLGDTSQFFCLQSLSKPMTYMLARVLEEEQNTTVHNHVGYEPSGRAFNEFVLNSKGLPHNPLINAGAIMVNSLIKPQSEAAVRYESLYKFYHKLAGHNSGMGFDNGVFLSEKQHADRNVSLAYYMRENMAFAGYPTASELQEHLDLYFQSCSNTVNCQAGAIMAATMANMGECPITQEKVLDDNIAKDALAIMYTCGMYDFSGQFSFQIGMPAKSGVSGAVMLCIPHVGGICIWSPPLDKNGNSVKAVRFCQEFAMKTEH